MSGADQTAATGHVLRRIGGRDVLFDAEGYMIDPEIWTEAVAETLAAEQGLAALDEPHWRVIRFLREYYQHWGKSPLSREVKKGTGLSLMEIDDLFPGGLKRGARRLAGLPNPRGCM